MSDYQVSKLGNYRIVRLIGRGGFANVYLGEHIYLKIPAAIKVLNIQLVNDTLENFLNEARIVALLEHPRIVRVLEFGVEDGITPFLVMNYAENGTLRHLYPRHSILPWGSILSYTRQVAEALQYAHGHGVIHRDVKPENMLLGKNKRIQLSDFGLALLVQGKPSLPSRSAGTTAYMAPEQLQGKPCPASDQYALGIVVYEWLCGSLPFTGSQREITIQQLYAPPPSLQIRVRNLTPAIERVIMKALAKDPSARFASVREFVEALEQAASSAALLTTSKQPAILPSISAPRVRKPIDAISYDASPLPQTPKEIPSAPDLFPQLPLLVYESPLTNNGRILQPSLEALAFSLGDQLSPPATFTSQEDTLPPPSETPSPFPIPTVQPFSSLPPSPPQPIAQSSTAQQDATLSPVHIAGSQKPHLLRHITLIALAAIALIGLIILATIGVWTQIVHPTQNVASNQHIGSLTSVTATVPVTTTVHRSNTPSATHQASANTPTTIKNPVVVPTSAVPTTISATQVPQLTPTSVPTTIPTTTVPLTVAILSAPKKAPAGSTISVVVQASRGGVSIALDGALRSFGTQIANSQGIATFVITVPLEGKRIVLTATAVDTNGDQAKSARYTIVIT